MKHFYHLVTLCLFVLALLFWIEESTRYRDFTQKVEVKLMAKDLRIDELEKEIRLLKTDMHILEDKVSEK